MFKGMKDELMDIGTWNVKTMLKAGKINCRSNCGLPNTNSCITRNFMDRIRLTSKANTQYITAAILFLQSKQEQDS
jgi:hypothetical protein